MELTIRETATLLGRRARTLRAQVARGQIPAVKKDGRWSIPRRAVPLTDAQRAAMHGRAGEVREAVEAVLPSVTVRHPGQRTRSVAVPDSICL
jgi:hypothetical protein